MEHFRPQRFFQIWWKSSCNEISPEHKAITSNANFEFPLCSLCYPTTMTNVSVNRCVSCLICAVTDYIFVPKYTIVFTSFIRASNIRKIWFRSPFPHEVIYISHIIWHQMNIYWRPKINDQKKDTFWQSLNSINLIIIIVYKIKNIDSNC